MKSPTLDMNHIGADKALEEIGFTDDASRPMGTKERYVAEQQQRLLKASDDKAKLSFNVRFLFFPIFIAIVLGLLFCSIDVSKAGRTVSGPKRLSERAQRKLRESQSLQAAAEEAARERERERQSSSQSLSADLEM